MCTVAIHYIVKTNSLFRRICMCVQPYTKITFTYYVYTPKLVCEPQFDARLSVTCTLMCTQMEAAWTSRG